MGGQKFSTEQVDVAMEPVSASRDIKAAPDASELERIASSDDMMKDGEQHYENIDAEVAKYASGAGIAISEEENIRLRHLISKRVLPIMVRC